MLKKIILGAITTLLILAAALVLSVRRHDCPIEERAIIAHAGGCIDSLRYTNSREAVEHAIAQGVKYIELDIRLSADGEPFALHSSQDLIEQEFKSYPPTIDEFRSKPLLGKNGKQYTPLTWCEINEIFLQHPDICLVVDKTDDPKILAKYFAQLKNRMIVECFTMQRYVEVSQSGFMLAMLSESAYSPSAVLKQNLKHLFCPDEPLVEMLAMWSGNYSNKSNRIFINLLNIPTAIWTASDRREADQLFSSTNARMVYCDVLEQ